MIIVEETRDAARPSIAMQNGYFFAVSPAFESGPVDTVSEARRAPLDRRSNQPAVGPDVPAGPFETPRRPRPVSIAAGAFASGADPLDIIRGAAETGELAADDPRQVAAAVTHPDPDKRIALPGKAYLNLNDILSDRRPGVVPSDVRIKTAALVKLDRSCSNRTQVAMEIEKYGMSLAESGRSDLAMGLLIRSMGITHHDLERRRTQEANRRNGPER